LDAIGARRAKDHVEGKKMNEAEVALIVGAGPGISASCARLFSQQGVQVAVAARDANKPALKALAEDHLVVIEGYDGPQPERASEEDSGLQDAS
jgi:NAD(P)-dependent dehydrogenase (short-subunit alcohol dehydrogenase family)